MAEVLRRQLNDVVVGRTLELASIISEQYNVKNVHITIAVGGAVAASLVTALGLVAQVPPCLCLHGEAPARP
jgi:hypothetical protein